MIEIWFCGRVGEVYIGYGGVDYDVVLFGVYDFGVVEEGEEVEVDIDSGCGIGLY